MQLAREPAALLLMLFQHAGREARELHGAGLQPLVQVGVGERGTHLPSERLEEVVIQRGEGIACIAGEHERT